MSKEKRILTSIEARDEIISNQKALAALDKIKAVPLFPGEMFVGAKQAANYYEVDYETIKGVLKRHREELLKDGVKTITGNELLYYKNNPICKEQEYIGCRNNRFICIPKRALLRIGMILTKSDVAETLRTYLLNLEDEATPQQKVNSIKKIKSEIKVEENLPAISENNLPACKEIYSEELMKLKFEASKELINVEKLINKAEILGVRREKAALLIQTALLENKDPETALAEQLKRLAVNSLEKQRGIIRLKVETIASDYYYDNYPKVYHDFSEKMKYKMGIDMQATRSRAKKKYGDKSKNVPSYLDLISTYNAWDEANEALDEILDECIAKEASCYKIETRKEKEQRIRKDKVKTDMYQSNKIQLRILNESKI